MDTIYNENDGEKRSDVLHSVFVKRYKSYSRMATFGGVLFLVSILSLSYSGINFDGKNEKISVATVQYEAELSVLRSEIEGLKKMVQYESETHKQLAETIKIIQSQSLAAVKETESVIGVASASKILREESKNNGLKDLIVSIPMINKISRKDRAALSDFISRNAQSVVVKSESDPMMLN